MAGLAIYVDSSDIFIGYGISLENYENLIVMLQALHQETKERHFHSTGNIPPVPEWGDQQFVPSKLTNCNDFEILLVNYRLKVESFLYAIGCLEKPSPTPTELIEEVSSGQAYSVQDMIQSVLMNSPSKPRRLERQEEMVDLNQPLGVYKPNHRSLGKSSGENESVPYQSAPPQVKTTRGILSTSKQDQTPLGRQTSLSQPSTSKSVVIQEPFSSPPPRPASLSELFAVPTFGQDGRWIPSGTVKAREKRAD